MPRTFTPAMHRTPTFIKKCVNVWCLATLVSCANTPSAKAPADSGHALATHTRLHDWLNHYHLQLNSFTDSAAIETRQCLTWDDNLATDSDNLYKGFFIYSPDSNHCIDLDSYALSLQRDAKGQLKALGYEPDSEVALIDPANHTRTRVMFCGTACIFEEVQWIDNDTFYVLGFDATGNKMRPTIWEHHNPQNTIREIHSMQTVNAAEINYTQKHRLKTVDFSAFR